MKNIEKISTNNIFKPFKKEGQHFYVECYGVDLNVDYFVPINEENISNPEKFEKWDFICKGKYFKDEIVLKVDLEKMKYKFGRVKYGTMGE